jgi:hypothetical protein
VTESFQPIAVVEIGQPGALPLRLSSLAEDGGRGLRVACDARLTESRQDSVTEITVWGLGTDTVAALRESGALCRAFAGWRGLGGTGQPSQIAAGRVLPGTVYGPVREGADWIARWSVTDGGLDVRDVLVSESWRGSVAASEILDRLIARSGLSRGEVRLGTDARWAGGYVVAGTLRRALAALARATGSVIVVQDGAIQAWPNGGTRRTSGALISSDTGLIDDPQPQDGGTWQIRSLLLPALRPGDGIRVESRQVTGSMRVLDVVHDVDTEGTACDTVLTARPL